ncbi:hypothetical protein PPL_05529 [Heterostelium album PN500]|uniref:VPS9 domain-containing protein n=1 Tax=Heterostelium pallidum (strain ATCC 26659 / Pp 5 / PN500) TaxID=670386 RepID=D3BAF3_HETP5|nr:hypothetical protein PPL_05529 [Heterostelium album PN500]EFA81540.1 hypothetical protein PPL_05529 [Heterostelium album PN500]|eukprot:XP_020433657.1 hypothetical protein PPL_05529 [Heterostelium album PN500]
MDTEDLNSNVFLKILKTKHPKIFNAIETNCYLLCIPQSLSLYGMNITAKIIVGSKFYQDEYESLNRDAKYNIENMLITDKSDPTKQIKILFAEMCYNREYKPYRFYCIEYPLVGGTGIKPSISFDNEEFGIIKPQKPTFENATQFLYSQPLNSPNSIVMKKVDNEIMFFEQTTNLENHNQTQVTELLSRMKEKFMDDLVCANAEYKELQTNEKQMNNLSLLLDSYLIGKLYDKIYIQLKEIYSEKNNYYYEKMAMLSNLTLEELGIRNEFAPHLARATEIMIQFQMDQTPIDKLLTIVQASNEIENSIKTLSLLELTDDNPLTITGDDALPLTSYLLIQAHPRFLETDLVYCTNYIFTDVSNHSFGYHLVNFQAGVEHIKQLIDQFAPNTNTNLTNNINNINNNESSIINNNINILSPNQHLKVKSTSLNLPTYLSSNSLLSNYTQQPQQHQPTIITSPPANNRSLVQNQYTSSPNLYNYVSTTSYSSSVTPLSPRGPDVQKSSHSSFAPSSSRYNTINSNNTINNNNNNNNNLTSSFQYHKYTKPPSVIRLDEDETGSPWTYKQQQ